MKEDWKNSLGEARIQPPEEVWTKIESSLNKKRRRGLIFWFGLMFIALGASGWYFIDGTHDSNLRIKVEESIVEEEKANQRITFNNKLESETLIESDSKTENGGLADLKATTQDERTNVNSSEKRSKKTHNETTRKLDKDHLEKDEEEDKIRTELAVNDMIKAPLLLFSGFEIQKKSEFVNLERDEIDPYVSCDCSNELVFIGHWDKFNYHFISQEFENFGTTRTDLNKSNGFDLYYSKPRNSRWRFHYGLGYSRINVEGQTKSISISNGDSFSVNDPDGFEDHVSIVEEPDDEVEIHPFSFELSRLHLNLIAERHFCLNENNGFSLLGGIRPGIYSKLSLDVGDKNLKDVFWFNNHSAFVGARIHKSFGKRFSVKLETLYQVNYDFDFSPSFNELNQSILFGAGVGYRIR